MPGGLTPPHEPSQGDTPPTARRAAFRRCRATRRSPATKWRCAVPTIPTLRVAPAWPAGGAGTIVSPLATIPTWAGTRRRPGRSLPLSNSLSPSSHKTGPGLRKEKPTRFSRVGFFRVPEKDGILLTRGSVRPEVVIRHGIQLNQSLHGHDAPGVQHRFCLHKHGPRLSVLVGK